MGRRLDLVSQPATLPDPYAIGEDDVICDPTTGLPLANWSDLATIVNKVDISYDFNDAALNANAFGRRQIWTADRSVQRYKAQQPVRLEARGVRRDLGGQAIMDRFALLFLQRWGYPPPILLLSTPYRRHLLEPLDTVYVTHSKIRNKLTGQLGLTNERFEVLNVTPQWMVDGRPQGRLDLALVWVGAIEQSAVPTSSGALSLVPGQSTVSGADVNVPLGSYAQVTTPGAPCSQIRLGFKALNYRLWRCTWKLYALNTPPKDQPPACVDTMSLILDRFTYNSKITYHAEYKTSTAPDQAGTGTDPTTGWVTLLTSTERGNTSLFASGLCGATPGAPSEDIWEHLFDSLSAAPSTYNVRAFFDAIATQGNPCPNAGHSCGCGDVFDSSLLEVDQQRLTLDFIEAIV